MDVRHYVIGSPVRTSDNDDFDFVATRSELPKELQSGRPIYTS